MTKPTAKHLALRVFAGRWMTQGTIRAAKDAAASEMRAIDQYEWLPGGFFMLHKVDALIASSVSQSLEVIGYDAEQACYVTRAYDDQGRATASRLNWQAKLGQSMARRFDSEARSTQTARFSPVPGSSAAAKGGGARGWTLSCGR